MKKIVILDPLPFSAAHLSQLKSVGEVTTYTTAPKNEEDIISRLKEHHIAITGWCHLPRIVLEQADSLECISLWAAGSDYVDLAAAKERNIKVFTAAGYAATAVAEFTLGCMLSLLHHIHTSAKALENGVNQWQLFQGNDLRAKTIGIIGYGAIAKRTIHLLTVFGSTILCYTRTPPTDQPDGVTFVDLDSLLSNSDIVSLHLPLTDESRNLLNRDRLLRMKKGAMLVNTARGAIIDENALFELLQNEHLAAAALDVFSIEPPVPSPKWYELKNIILTPHIAFNSVEASEQKTTLCIKNVVNFIKH